jgi:hypothetical protein
MNPELRTERRYFVVTPFAAEVAGSRADLVDLSGRGARLQVTKQLQPGTPVALKLPVGSGTVELSATPVWCEMAALAISDEEMDRYLCGVTFETTQPEVRQLIDELLASGAAIPIEEGRGDDRFRVIAPITASFANLSSLRVLDLSIRGARVMTPALLATGASGRLRLTINGNDTPVWLPATVMWSRPAERKGRFEAGLRITDAREFLRIIIDELAMGDGVVIETDSLRRKFDPFAVHPVPGLVAVRRW